MIDTIKDASKFFAAPVALLYVLGFICVSGFYGQFGIVTFELINARFLIAGIYVAIAFSMSILASWWIFGLVSNARDNNWRVAFRLSIYAAIVGFPLLLATFLSTIMLIANRGVNSHTSKLALNPILGEHDFVGHLLALLFSKATELTWIVFYSLNLAGLLMVCWVFYEAFRDAIEFLPMSKERTKEDGTKPPTSRTDATPMDNTETEGAPTKSDPKPLKSEPRITFLFDIGCGSALLVLMIFATKSLYSNVYDINAIASSSETSLFALTFHWLYAASVPVFVVVTRVRTTNSPFEFLQEFVHFSNITETFQFIAVPIIALIFSFGSVVYPRIPYPLGGGEPREVRITSTNANWQSPEGKVFMLGENSQYLFVAVTDGTTAKSYELNKNSVTSIEFRPKPATKQTSIP